MYGRKIFNFCQLQVAKKRIFLPPKKADLLFLRTFLYQLVRKDKLNSSVFVTSQKKVQKTRYKEKKLGKNFACTQYLANFYFQPRGFKMFLNSIWEPVDVATCKCNFSRSMDGSMDWICGLDLLSNCSKYLREIIF